MPQAGLHPPQQAAAGSTNRAASPPRQPAAAKPPPRPPPPPTADGVCPGSPASPLPPHLQHAVHRALSDLQAQRLLYPQQCAAAEQAANGERQEANRHASAWGRRALAALGGTSFDYSAAAAELVEARRSAKQLLRPRRGACAGACSITASRAAAPAAAAAEPAAASSSVAAEEGEDEQALWGSYQALSAAVGADVDRRIAAARLHPPAAASRSPTRQPRMRPAAPEAKKPPAAAPDSPTGSRRPLGSLQHAVPAVAAERKRGRSPHERYAAGRRKALVQPAAAAAGPDPQAASPPSSKRLRPHVAFGTRCDAPRRAAGARGGKAVQLDASTAPTPPQLPPVHPAEPAAARQPARRDPLPSSALPAAAAAPAPRSDLLRSLAAAFAGGSSSRAQRSSCQQPAESPSAATLAVQEGGGSSSSSGGGGEAGRMRRMLADLTAALQGMSLPTDGSLVPDADDSGNGSGSGSGSAPSLQSTLQLHGLGDAAAAQDACTLLQGVLDRMDAIALRAHSPEPGPSAGVSPPPAGMSPGAEQLCSQLDRLVDAGSIELRARQQQVAVAQQAEAAVERINAAAVEAALAGAEAAAAAAGAHRASSQPAAAKPQLQQRATPLAAGRMPAAAVGPSPGLRAASPLLAPPDLATLADGPRAAPASELAPAAELELAAAAAGEPQASQPPPADGWPVQWPATAPVLGVPLLWPPGQSQWLAPGTLNPAGWHTVPPLLGVPALGHQCVSQPALQGPQQQAQPSPEWPGGGWQADGGQAFSVASDEQLPGSPEPEASAPGSPGSPRGSGGTGEPCLDQEAMAPPPAEAEQGQLQGAEQTEHAERQQALLDAAAERAIQLYQQHHNSEQHAMAAAADAACAWDVAMRARDGAWGMAAADGAPTDEPSGAAPGAAWEEPSCLPGAAGVAPAPAFAQQQLPIPGAATSTLQVLAPPDAAPPPPPRARPALPPYNPLRAVAERAAADRLAEEAAGWRRLRQRADELALWHEYAAALGLDGAEPAAGPPLLLEPPPAVAAPRLAEGADAGTVRLPALVPVAERHRLWRLGPPALLPAPPTVELSPLPPPSSSTGGASSGSSSSGTPAGSSLLGSEASGSCAATESSTSSLGIGARHKARALRYRLLRRRLEAAAAAGLRVGPLADDPSEGCLTPLTAASLSTPSARPPSSWGGDLETVPEWTPTAPGQAMGRRWDAGEPELQAAPQPPWAAAGDQPSPPVAQRSDEATPCAAAATLPGGLGDHLSDATTPASSCSSLAPAVAAAVTGRARLLSGSSCSTLQEVAAGRR